MKIYFFLSLLLLSFSRIQAKDCACCNAYVWTFALENVQKSKFSSDLTDQVESILINRCTILKRQNLINLLQQANNEQAIFTTTHLSDSAKQQVIVTNEGALFRGRSENKNLNLGYKL
jgi:hypothetical protein